MEMTKINLYAAFVLRLSLGVMFVAHGLLKVLVFTLPGTVQFFDGAGFAGWLAYPSGTFIAGLAPYWIVGMWMLFATTLNITFRWLHERMWLASNLYDLVVIIGHNDDPVVPGAGSAIFIHCARPGYTPTEGCVAFAADELLILLAELEPESRIDIRMTEK